MSGAPHTMASEASLFVRNDADWRLNGALTFASVPALMDDAGPRWRTTPRELRIDLGSVTRSDSAGLALLVEWVRLAALHDTRIEFTGMPQQLQTLADVTGLANVLGTGA